MRILVTGATGRVGSRLVPRLLKRNDTIRVLVRKAEQGDAFQRQGAEVVVGDLLQPDTLTRATDGVDAVVHLAAFFRGATASQAQAVNDEGSQALAQAAWHADVSRFVYISTNLVYGHGRGRPALETDAPQPAPDQFYPVSKLAAERVLQNIYQAKASVLCILRLPFVYGEGDPHLAEAVRFARVWNPAKRLQMAHHADVGQAIQLAIYLPEAAGDAPGGRIYNVADDQPVTTAEILRLNNLPEDETGNTPLDDPWEGIVDTTRIREELNYRPLFPSVYQAKDAEAL